MGGWALVVLFTALSSRPALTDQALAAYADSGFDKAAKMFKHEDVGRYRGVRVVADFPCSDLCPASTVRIIHFDVPPGADCERVGGRTVELTVPIAIAVTKKPFCVPAILADRKG